ncbi:hypothetical protein JW933_00955 [candidate division FCPU426 bacterium]|nr:hypothetical protein [candidate division FCPU426 bacterium]
MMMVNRRMVTRVVLSAGLILGLGLAIQAQDQAAPHISSASLGRSGGEALLEARLPGWDEVESMRLEVEEARRLASNFSLKEEFSPEGRTTRRERVDGTRETITYDDAHGRVSVWVLSPDGKFQAERLYQHNRLRAVLHADGSLKTLQYIGPLSREKSADSSQAATPALYLMMSTATQARILQYNPDGRLISGFLPEGTPIMRQTSSYADELKNIIPPDELYFRALPEKAGK